MPNLLRDSWRDIDPHEIRLILDKRIGGPGQFDDRPENPSQFFLPLARDKCKVALTFREKEIASIEPGTAFDEAEWSEISDEIAKLSGGPVKIGREVAFNTFRVTGCWRGIQSKVQILPPQSDWPRAPVESAAHPFILEFPINTFDSWFITNYRRNRQHRRWSRVLNVLLIPRARRCTACTKNSRGEGTNR